jgi:hypothetical protein
MGETGGTMLSGLLEYFSNSVWLQVTGLAISIQTFRFVVRAIVRVLSPRM